MNRKIMFKIYGGLLILLFLTACTTQTLTLTIKGNECTIDSPKSIPYGKFTVKLIIEEEKPSDLGYQIVKLEDGKTIEDLKGWPSIDFPEWVTVLFDDPHESASISTTTRTYNLTDLTIYHGEPLYFVCIQSNPVSGNLAKIGAYGPFEVKK